MTIGEVIRKKQKVQRPYAGRTGSAPGHNYNSSEQMGTRKQKALRKQCAMLPLMRSTDIT